MVNLDQYITVVNDAKISVFWYNPPVSPDYASDDDYNLLGGRQIRLSSDQSFRLLNSWYFGNKYIYMHLLD